jgi:hypothetical protein
MISRRTFAAGAVLALSLAYAGGVVVVARAAELTFVLRIEKGRVPADKRLIRVKQGDIVNLRWSTDRRVVLHLHGYDIAKEVVPGAITEMTFTARATGRFTVEPHLANAPSGGHVHGAALVTIAIYP